MVEYDHSEVNPLKPYELLGVAPTATKAEIRNAYRTLARRWHPDRFMEGPERDWANEKMAEINAAYHSCLTQPMQPASREEETLQLKQIEELISVGHYPEARQRLMAISSRCAEWNYLFGAVLMKTADVEKALIYLGVAARQQPDNAKYARALRDAQEAHSASRMRLLSRFRRTR